MTTALSILTKNLTVKDVVAISDKCLVFLVLPSEQRGNSPWIPYLEEPDI